MLPKLNNRKNTTTDNSQDKQLLLDAMQQIIDGTSINDISTDIEHIKEGNAKVEQSVTDINSMSEHMYSINERIRNIYDAVNTQTKVTNNFVSSIESIADSYDILTKYCITTGNHLYKCGRYIDTARSDMARGFSELTTQDWLSVFQIVHLLLINVLHHFRHHPKCKHSKQYTKHIINHSVKNSSLPS